MKLINTILDIFNGLATFIGWLVLFGFMLFGLYVGYVLLVPQNAQYWVSDWGDVFKSMFTKRPDVLYGNTVGLPKARRQWLPNRLARWIAHRRM